MKRYTDTTASHGVDWVWLFALSALVGIIILAVMLLVLLIGQSGERPCVRTRQCWETLAYGNVRVVDMSESLWGTTPLDPITSLGSTRTIRSILSENLFMV